MLPKGSLVPKFSNVLHKYFVPNLGFFYFLFIIIFFFDKANGVSLDKKNCSGRRKYGNKFFPVVPNYAGVIEPLYFFLYLA